MTATWVIMTVLGIIIQIRLLKSHPDFPESPYKKRIRERLSLNASIQGRTHVAL